MKHNILDKMNNLAQTVSDISKNITVHLELKDGKLAAVLIAGVLSGTGYHVFSKIWETYHPQQEFLSSESGIQKDTGSPGKEGDVSDN